MHRSTLIRTLSHGYNSHNPYAVLTGFAGGNDRENYFAKPNDHPSMGAVCQYLGIGRGDVPGHVARRHTRDGAKGCVAPALMVDTWEASTIRW